MLGDSITSVSEADIRAQMQTTYLTSVSAVCGHTSAEIYRNSLLYAPAADVVIVNVGTNDYPTIDLGATFDNIAAIRSHFTGECFAVATLNQHTGTPALNAFAEQFNFYLVFGGQYPIIVDLNAFAAAHPDYFYDTVHPNQGLGTQGYAALVRDAADRCLRSVTPFGTLDAATTLVGNLTVSGWAIDPETAASIKVHVYVDGQFRGEYPADRPRPDVANFYPAYGPAHGYQAAIPVAAGRHSVCVFAINVGTGTNNPVLGCRTVDSGRPFGALDQVHTAPGGVEVIGWAVDPDTVDPIEVHVYVDGRFQTAVTADRLRPDVASVHPEFGPSHGVDVVVPAAGGPRRVDLWAIDAGGGANPLLGTKVVTVIRGNPLGSLDAARAGTGTITVAGWTFDPDDAASGRVHVYVDGRYRGEFTADRSRPDVAAVYPGFGPDRGFEATVPADAGTANVCVFAINTGSGTTNPVLGCGTVLVSG